MQSIWCSLLSLAKLTFFFQVRNAKHILLWPLPGVPHSAADDTIIQGYTIPKDSLIFSNIWAVHHNPDLWNDPEVFRPERFLNETGDVLQPDYYIPFSSGRCFWFSFIFLFFPHTWGRCVFQDSIEFKHYIGDIHAISRCYNWHSPEKKNNLLKFQTGLMIQM